MYSVSVDVHVLNNWVYVLNKKFYVAYEIKIVFKHQTQWIYLFFCYYYYYTNFSTMMMMMMMMIL